MVKGGAELAKSGTYDRMCSDEDTSFDNPTKSQYYPMFRKSVHAVKSMGINNVLEVGCGSGILAEMLMERLVNYTGFDISPVGVEKAKNRNRAGNFFVGDATSATSYLNPYDGILCCEVLGHIEDDLGAISQWRSRAPVVCSVPNFGSHPPGRHFRNEKEVIARYGDLIDITAIVRINKPIHSLVTKFRYLQQLRGAAMKGDFKGVGGLLGIKQFDWHGGWFLFEGYRR